MVSESAGDVGLDLSTVTMYTEMASQLEPLGNRLPSTYLM